MFRKNTTGSQDKRRSEMRKAMQIQENSQYAGTILTEMGDFFVTH